jgi:hypothetical protein
MKSSIPKSKFTPDEDKLITRVLRTHGIANWDSVHANPPRRNGRQCRGRWTNSVESSIEIRDWIQEEEMRFVQRVDSIGPHRKLIAEFVEDGSSSSCRNRFLTIHNRNSGDSMVLDLTPEKIPSQNQNKDPFSVCRSV